jgi:hypothetical protein
MPVLWRSSVGRAPDLALDDSGGRPAVLAISIMIATAVIILTFAIIVGLGLRRLSRDARSPLCRLLLAAPTILPSSAQSRISYRRRARTFGPLALRMARAASGDPEFDIAVLRIA